MNWLPPLKEITRWKGAFAADEQIELYEDWLRALPQLPAVPHDAHPTFALFHAVLRGAHALDFDQRVRFQNGATIRNARDYDPHYDEANRRAAERNKEGDDLIEELLRFSGEITPETVKVYRNRVEHLFFALGQPRA